MPVRNLELVGQLTAELFDELEAEHGEAVINAAIIVLDITYGDEHGVGFKSTDTRAWFQEALLNEAIRVGQEEEE